MLLGEDAELVLVDFILIVSAHEAPVRFRQRRTIGSHITNKLNKIIKNSKTSQK